MTAAAKPNIAFIGFGEAGQAMAAGLRDEGVTDIAAWDLLFADASGDKLKDAAKTIGVRVASSAVDAVRDARIVIVAVTAASSMEGVRSIGDAVQDGAFVLDVNSVSPGRKRDTAKLVRDGARYVDVAILSPIHPHRHKSPLLLAGPHAGALHPLLAAMNMNVTVAGDAVGGAAAIKMVRSVMIKGIEALTLECFLAATRAGVADQVAASLRNNYPSLDWPAIVEYNIERMVSHGIRRAAEMEEVSETLQELGVQPLMTDATVRRQRAMGEIGREAAIKHSVNEGRAAMLDAISATAQKKTQ